MKKKLLAVVVGLVLAVSMVAGVATSRGVYATDPAPIDYQQEILNGAGKTGGEGDKDTLINTVRSIIQTVLMIVGLLAVVMIIVGGIQYTTSAGKQETVTKAKNTIIYGIVGLVISLLAYAIVNFVVGKLTTS